MSAPTTTPLGTTENMSPSPATTSAPPSLGALVRYFLYLGTFVFGGPVVLVERMRRDLQEVRGWFTVQEYRDGLALAQLAPGPLAAQLAIYLGWARAGVMGATLVGAAFIVPSFLMVLALSAAYLRYGGLPWMRGAFYGIGAAVIALIAHSAWKLVRKTVGTDRLLWVIVVVNAALTAWSEREIVWVILLSGLLVLAVRAWPSRLSAGAGSAAIVLPAWWLTGMHGMAPAGVLATLMIFFAKAGAVVFGSGLAIVPYMHHGVVEEFRWITEREFLDAVAVSMITPGPVVITVAFIGYLTAGLLGAIAAAIGVFLPTYLFVVLLAGWYHRFSHNRQLRAVVDGVTAAATGAIAGAAIVLGRRALIDVPTWLIFAIAMGSFVWSKRKIPEPLLIVAAGVVGVALQSAQATTR